MVVDILIYILASSLILSFSWWMGYVFLKTFGYEITEKKDENLNKKFTQ